MLLFHTIRFSCNLQPHNSPFINPSTPIFLHHYLSLLSSMASSSSSFVSTKLFATILVLYLLASLTFTEACGSCKPPKPKPKPCPTPAPAKCPLDTLKLGVCADVLGLVHVVVGSPPTSNCCPLLAGLADLEAALCLCTAIKANVLGINLNVPLSLSLILSSCQKSVPSGFQCP